MSNRWIATGVAFVLFMAVVGLGNALAVAIAATP